MEVSMWMWMNKMPHLSPTVYNILLSLADSKVDIHYVYIKARKDPVLTWTKLPIHYHC